MGGSGATELGGQGGAAEPGPSSTISEDLPMDIAGSGGMMTTEPEPTGDDFVEGVNIAVHDEVNTILVVTWSQSVAAEQAWLEFTFEDGNVMRSRGAAGAVGEHRDVVLGVPGETDVTVRIVSQSEGKEYRTQDYSGRTDAVPSGANGFPTPTVVSYDPSIASPDRWLFGSVENSPGGSSQRYYLNQFWLYIMDRKGRVVWYYANPGSLATYSFQRIARDGEYIVFENRCYGCGNFAESVIKMTLDHGYFEEIPVPGLADAIDVTTDGSLLYDANNQLMERTANGQTRMIWNCRQAMGQNFQCYSNTINWDPPSNTVMMSFPDPGVVVQIDRASGQLIGQYGARAGSYTFAPPLTTPPTAWNFGFQHNPNITSAGTLLVSSHMPGFEETSMPVANQHAFVEFEIDRANRVLTEKWRYTDGPEWPHAKGMAIRLPNGNTLANYGTGGTIREITPDKRTAFHVKFDAPNAANGNDFYNKMVGNNVLINDLYALNGGGPR